MGIIIKELAVTHKESHSKASWMRDVILGGQDGLVNVLGIVLGVSAASQDKKILIAASLAAAFAEAVFHGGCCLYFYASPDRPL